MEKLVEEVVLPESKRSLWVKILSYVDPKARNAYGFEGKFHSPGEILDLPAGTLVLERVAKRDNYEHYLWALTEEGKWAQEAFSNRRAWALDLRDTALDLLIDREET